MGEERGLAEGREPATAKGHQPGRIANEYSLLLLGEAEALQTPPQVKALGAGTVEALHGGKPQTLAVGDHLGGWVLLAVMDMNGVSTAVFEKHVTHRGAIAYVTERGGTIALLPKGVGDLAQIRPRPVNAAPSVRFQRPLHVSPGSDVAGPFLLGSNEDPCYENVAALGPEYIGWTLVSSDGAGPERSVYLQADCVSREPKANADQTWAPDMDGALFDPSDFFPFDAPEQYEYKPGYSKRTLLGGYLPVADTGVWNAQYQCGYELIMLLPPEPDARPMARMRIRLPASPQDAHTVRPGVVREPDGHLYRVLYWNTSPDAFYRELAGTWNHWRALYEDTMPVEIPDPWLLDAARAGITLSRCSYRGLEPTYQVGEGAYTKVPERSHALFPVAHYEFIWAHQLWGLTRESRPYAQHYLDKYILPDGNFLYNTQDQVEAPLNVGIFLMNAARDYRYTRDSTGLLAQRPVLDRMLGYVLERYAFSKTQYSKEDRRYGLIWGSPEADLGETGNDYPNSHPFYYQNAACVWRGLHEYAAVLLIVGKAGNQNLAEQGRRYAALAEEMRANIQRSLEATIAASTPAMQQAGITPFEPNDIARKPSELSSYENHRFMMDWFLADWGVPALDEGHLKHRALAGQELCGLHTDGTVPRTSNFMEHGTLAVKIRRDDYRSFLLTLYALVCYAADSGNRYAPEDAYLPGSFPGEQSRYGWSAVINSTLQPTLGLRWLLCYEENDREVCHLQKAAPKHWFSEGQRISMRRCPTRFGELAWSCVGITDREWEITLEPQAGFSGDILLHIHPPDGAKLKASTEGEIAGQTVKLPQTRVAAGGTLKLTVTT